MPYALREALAAFRRAPLLTGLSGAMIGLSLFVVGLFGIVAHNIRLVLEQVEERVEVVAYLRDGATPQVVELITAEISSFPEVAAVDYVSKDQALANARSELDEFRTIFGDLDVNPLPASLEVHMRPGMRNAEVVRDIAERIRAYEAVEETRFGQEWIDKVFLLRRVAGVATAVLGGAFAVVSILIIGSAVRMAIFARRDEIRIMQLVGATDAFVRRPFVLEGAMTGLIGAAIALPALYIVYQLLSGAIIDIVWLPTSWIAAGIASGALLGFAASALAVRRHVREL
ncbi:MAG TPA: permease-like cell division protein FtsX [Longimicrobiales bacterium]|nr:permease-like cell division protein FtsX [Longimicrobiales bacterium]